MSEQTWRVLEGHRDHTVYRHNVTDNGSNIKNLDNSQVPQQRINQSCIEYCSRYQRVVSNAFDVVAMHIFTFTGICLAGFSPHVAHILIYVMLYVSMSFDCIRCSSYGGNEHLRQIKNMFGLFFVGKQFNFT